MREESFETKDEEQGMVERGESLTWGSLGGMEILSYHKEKPVKRWSRF